MIRLLLVLGAVLAMPRAADACGEWHMTDKETSHEIKWLIAGGTITDAKDKKLGSLYLDTKAKPTPKVVAGKTVVFDVVGKKLRKRGKPIGSIDGDTITIGKAKYAITWGTQSDYHGMPAWEVTVKRGETVVIVSAQATALCAGMSFGISDSDEDQREIRQRIAYYLAWRIVGSS